MRKIKFKNRTFGTNAIDGATTTGKHWGFIPVPCKGGATTNAIIIERKRGAENEEK